MAHNQLVVFDSKVCFQARHGFFQESNMNTHHFLRWFPWFPLKKSSLKIQGIFECHNHIFVSHPGGANRDPEQMLSIQVPPLVCYERNRWTSTIWLFNRAMGNDPFIDGLPINVVFAGSGIWSCISFFEISPLFLRGDIKWWNDNANVGADNSPFLEILDSQMTLNQISPLSNDIKSPLDSQIPICLTRDSSWMKFSPRYLSTSNRSTFPARWCDAPLWNVVLVVAI